MMKKYVLMNSTFLTIKMNICSKSRLQKLTKSDEKKSELSHIQMKLLCH